MRVICWKCKKRVKSGKSILKYYDSDNVTKPICTECLLEETNE